jgi:hypothetical protein
VSVLVSKGAATIANSEKTVSTPREKTEFLRLKSGQSARVAFLRDSDNPEVFASAEFYSHGDFQAKIYSHPCIAVVEKCPSCEAGVPRSKRYLIAFLDLEDGKRKVFECSKKQYNGIKAAVADYTEDGSIFELPFKLSKSGTGTETVLNITPILKATAADKERLADTATPIDPDFFDNALGNPTADYIREKIAGYKPAAKEQKDDDPTKQF